MNISIPPYLGFLLSQFNTGNPREGQMFQLVMEKLA